tara:strand:- start:22166 stop:22771 length:606 start_codon:yes stop_codon:yes gene_type:complete
MSRPTLVENLTYHFTNNYKFTSINTDKNTVESSVSIILRKIDLNYEVLLIKRTVRKTDKFSGHMAFPGGVKEKFDKNSLSTARRETKEEVGLDLEKDSVYIGRFSDYRPVNPEANRFIVSPFIFYLTNSKVDLKKCLEEVDDAVWIPLDILLLNLENSNRKGLRYDKPYSDNVFEYKGYKIWGMTGKILYAFLLEIERYTT